MYTYETIFITIPDIPENDLKTIKTKVEKAISDEKGKIIKSDSWGIRKLAYEIKHNRKGNYLYYNFTSNPQAINEIERHLKLNEKVLRFLTVKREEKKPSEKKDKKKTTE